MMNLTSTETSKLFMYNLSLMIYKNETNIRNYTEPIKRIRQSEKIIIYSILFVIASVGNTTSFVALLFMNKERKKKNKSKSRIRLLMMNLCMADLMVNYIN
jgi:hypothetical protein